MKKTFTANIGGMVFHIDEDAYEKLNTYIESLKRHYSNTEGKEEIISDIELRIAELLKSKMSNSKEVIVMSDVESVINIMGKVEEFEESTHNEAHSKSENTHSKKLYRDDDDKVIAGVCSGIASYVGTEALWIRIGFIVTTLLFSFGFWLYLILWIIVPKARTTKEKLEMKGKKINISNIEDTIKEDIEFLKKKLNNFSDEAKDVIKDKNYKKRKGIEKFLYLFVSIIGYFFKTIAIIIGFVFIFLGIFLLIGFIGSFFSSFPIQIGSEQISISSLSIPIFLDTIFPSRFDIYTAIIGLVFLIATPLFMFVYYGFKLVFGFKYSNKIIGFTTFSLWIIGFVLCMISSLQVVRAFSNKGVATEKIISHVKEGQKIILNISEDKDNDMFSDEGTLQFGHLNMTSTNGKYTFYGTPKIEISSNNSKDEIEVRLLYSARGSNKEDALKNAKSMLYPVSIKDTVIDIPHLFLINESSKWRNQNLKVQIRVPNEKDIIFSNSTREFLDKMEQ